MALIISKFERSGFDLEAIDTLHKATPIGAATELAVGYHLQTDLLLKGNHIADAPVL